MPDAPHNSTRPLITSRASDKPHHHRVEVSAGGLVFRRRQGRLELAMVRDAFGRWTFPKGHVQTGETYARTAIREIGEETGLTGIRYVRRLGTIDIWFRDRFVHKGRLIHKFIHYFLFEAPRNAVLRRPVVEGDGEQIAAVAWVSAESVLKRSSYADLRPIIGLAMRALRVRQIRPPSQVIKPHVN